MFVLCFQYKGNIIFSNIGIYSTDVPLFRFFYVSLHYEVTKKVYFIGNERMLIAHDSNRLRFS